MALVVNTSTDDCGQGPQQSVANSVGRKQPIEIFKGETCCSESCLWSTAYDRVIATAFSILLQSMGDKQKFRKSLPASFSIFIIGIFWKQK